MSRPTPEPRATKAGSGTFGLTLTMLSLVALSGCPSSCMDATGRRQDEGPSPDSKASTLAAAVEAASEPYPRASWRLSDTPTSSKVIGTGAMKRR